MSFSAEARARVTGIVLAGGRSTRMGRDKAAIELAGRTLLQRAVDSLEVVAAEIIVVQGGRGSPLPRVVCEVPLRMVDDAVEGEGPLRGIAAGLGAATGEVAVVVSCDAPFLEPALLALLAGHAVAGAPAVAPVFEGELQPLCSAWRCEVLPALLARLDAGERAVHGALDALLATRLAPEDYRAADPRGRSFINLNTPADVERWSSGAPHEEG